MRIRFKRFHADKGWHYSFGDFFNNIVKYSDPDGGGCQRYGIEDRVDNTAQLVGNMLETLLIRGVINADDIDRIIGSYHPKVEIIDNE